MNTQDFWKCLAATILGGQNPRWNQTCITLSLHMKWWKEHRIQKTTSAFYLLKTQGQHLSIWFKWLDPKNRLCFSVKNDQFYLPFVTKSFRYPKMQGFLHLIRLFWLRVFHYINLTYSFHRWGFLPFGVPGFCGPMFMGSKKTTLPTDPWPRLPTSEPASCVVASGRWTDLYKASSGRDLLWGFWVTSMWGDFFLGHLEEAGTNDVLGVKYIYIYIITSFIPCFKRLCVLFWC